MTFLIDPAHQVDADYPLSHSRFLAHGAMQKDDKRLNEVFSLDKKNHLFFTLTDSEPWWEAIEPPQGAE